MKGDGFFAKEAGFDFGNHAETPGQEAVEDGINIQQMATKALPFKRPAPSREFKTPRGLIREMD